MIELKNIYQHYGKKVVYDNFNLNIEENKTLAILGNSGSGKTTLLNIMAGLLSYEGEIIGKGEKTSYVFQNDRLLPHMTVEKNLLLVSPKANVITALDKVGLRDYLTAYPSSLSAGMKRRVSILRAFLYEANVILLDEPFRNLDLSLKYKLMDFFKDLNIDKPKTALLVTHDIDEAVYVADRIIVIEKSKIIFDEQVIEKEKLKEKLKKVLLSL